jgi:hypothetical protein
MTPARLAASRRNAQKSTGPRTACGKAQSRLNALRHGYCSPIYRQLRLALFEAPPGYPVALTVQSALTPQEIANPVYSDLISVHLEMECEDVKYRRRLRRQQERQAVHDLKRSQELVENNLSAKTATS